MNAESTRHRNASDKRQNETGQRLIRYMANRLMRAFWQMSPGPLSGGDSGLASVWDEVCVQVQFGESVYWDTYIDMLESLAEQELKQLKVGELETVWLLSQAGLDWRCDHEPQGPDKPLPALVDEAAGPVVSELLNQASNWSNARIRRFGETTY